MAIEHFQRDFPLIFSLLGIGANVRGQYKPAEVSILGVHESIFLTQRHSQPKSPGTDRMIDAVG